MISRLNGWPAGAPLSTLHSTPRCVQRMTRGLGDSPCRPSIELVNQLRTATFAGALLLFLQVRSQYRRKQRADLMHSLLLHSCFR